MRLVAGLVRGKQVDLAKAGIDISDLFDEASGAVANIFFLNGIVGTGKTVGPPLLESLEILGKVETLARLKTE